MAIEKYDELYESFLDQKDKFFDELEERCSETKLYEVRPDDIEFYSSEIDIDSVNLRRLENNTVMQMPIAMTNENKPLWKSGEVERVGLFVKFATVDGETHILPVSPLCKLSLSNRAKFTFSGDLSITVNKLSLACLYEELLKKEAKKETLQIISVYGKAQAVMTNVYSPISHDDFFKVVDEKVSERFGENTVEFRKGYVSHKWSRGIWYIGEFDSQNNNNQQKIKLGLSAMDGQTGHCGAILQPCLFTGRKERVMLFDDTWYSKHMSLSEDGITNALDTVYETLNDNAQKLIDTIDIELNNPEAYANKLCDALNALAKQKSSGILPKKTIESFVSSVTGLEAIRSTVTVWDVIEILWDIPEATKSSEAHRDALMKTVSRAVALNHTALNAA